MDQAPPRDRFAPLDYLLITLIFGLLGAFFWAIRGTGGYGGAAGGALAGLGWAMLWYGFSRLGGAPRHRALGTGYLVAAITLGIAIGGLTGYGVYISWLRGEFHLAHGETGIPVLPLSPLVGYGMLFICGLHWGGVPGAFIAWCAPTRPVNAATWFARIAAGVGGALLALAVVRGFPAWFLPYFGEGYYANEAYHTAQRAQGSIQTIAPHVGAFLGFLLYEAVRRDGRAVAIILLMALGFAIPFTVGGYWQTAPIEGARLPWWKFWEMTIGLGGGLTFGLLFWLFNRPQAATQAPPVGWRERHLAAGLVAWLAAGFSLSNAIDGFTNHFQLELPAGVREGVTAAFMVALLVFGMVWWRLRKRDAETVLPLGTPAALLALIILCGYVVSIHLNWSSEHRVLLPMYTVYLVLCAGLFAALWRRTQHRDS